MTKEQVLFLRLILRSQFSWDKKAIEIIQREIGARLTIPDEKMSQDGYPLVCVGCNSVIDERRYAGFPIIVDRCPDCNQRPLSWKGANLWRGEAKLKYLYDAFFWPTYQSMLHHINIQIEEMRNAKRP